MKVKIQMSSNEKKAAIIIVVLLALLAYWYNRRYLYVLDAEFEDGDPVSITLKTGFIFPVKTFIPLSGGKVIKIKNYGYKTEVKETSAGYDLYIDNKKVYTVYPDQYYVDNKKFPTGRIFFS